jgi:hypothetical protein
LKLFQASRWSHGVPCGCIMDRLCCPGYWSASGCGGNGRRLQPLVGHAWLHLLHNVRNLHECTPCILCKCCMWCNSVAIALACFEVPHVQLRTMAISTYLHACMHIEVEQYPLPAAVPFVCSNKNAVLFIFKEEGIMHSQDAQCTRVDDLHNMQQV